jgi:hypothetical protein
VKVEYRGPHKAVEVPLGDGSAVVVRRGEAAEFPEAVASGLIVQSSWRAVKDKTDDEPAPKAGKAGKDGK